MTVSRLAVSAARAATAAALAVGAWVTPASAAALHARLPVPARLSGRPMRIHDTTVTSPGRREALAHAARFSGYGGPTTAADGSVITVYESDAYTPDPTLLQAWADFLAGLPHGSEINDLTVYIAPYEEMQRICSDTADACYDPDSQTMVVTGDDSPDGTPVEDLGAHELGHHIALHRDNSPWNAYVRGPKYWSTQLHVCEAVDNGDMVLGDEGDNYSLNPAEGWAETYRVLAAQSPYTWDIVDPLFQPDQLALNAARRDVEDPWQGDEYITRHGRTHKGRWRQYRVPVQNDGTIRVDVHTTGTLDEDIYIYRSYRARHDLQSARRTGGHAEHLHGTYCGYRHLVVALYAFSGRGRFRAKLSLPYTS
jgi:hypothetical protein